MGEDEAIFFWINPFPLIGDYRTFPDNMNWKDLVDDKFYHDYINTEYSSNT